MYITPKVVAKEIGTSTSSTSFSEMEIGLGVKGTGLRQKETLANNKLQKMVADQTESEKRKESAENLSSKLETPQVRINMRKKTNHKGIWTEQSLL